MAERHNRRLADQDPAINAEVAAEIERLRDELAEAREQLAATSEVLAVLGRSASDLDAVLSTVVESARKLCGADVGLVAPTARALMIVGGIGFAAVCIVLALRAFAG